jgi:hypothetical protein
MAMSKKDFISLTDTVRAQNWAVKEGMVPTEFSDDQIHALAGFCGLQNPRFDRERWIDYINGKCTANGRYFTEKELARKGEK